MNAHSAANSTTSTPPVIFAASGTRSFRFALAGLGAAVPAASVFPLRFTACAPFFVFFTWLSNMVFPFIVDFIYASF